MTTVTKAGRYEITGEIGRGAMGVVYKAVDPVIGRTVAVKTIRLSEEGTGLTRPELLVRFQTEARAAGLLTHPNIVVVFDAGEENGLYYITMELVEGKSLQALLDSGQAFPFPRTLRIMEQTCGALQFAHERNVIHRDIKPANLMLTADDTVKVTDFGTAKILQFGTAQQTAHVMGTPSYMSPEQVKGRAVDGRSDIFSLGVMLYEMVTGEKPFPGQNITTVIYKIVNEEPIPPRQINPSIHPGISNIVMRALTKDPDQRYQSCRELMDDLHNYRALAITGGNPQETTVSGARLSGTGTPLGTPSLRVPAGEDPRASATVRSLTSRASSPGQTPQVRRTATIAAVIEPKKTNIVGTIFAALFLLGVIVFGAYKLRPVFDDARQLRAAKDKASSLPSATVPAAAPENKEVIAADPTGAPLSKESSPTESNPEAKTAAVPIETPPTKKVDSGLSAKTAEYKGRIEEAIAEHGLSGRARIQGSGNMLTLAGKLKPSEHGALLKFLRDAPADVRLVDHIEYDDTPSENHNEGDHPVPGAGRGGIHVVTDVLGATAVLHGPAGRILNTCQTPCSFNNLSPARYSLEVQKEGYQPVQTALQVTASNVEDQKINLESLAKGLYITSKPSGADVFINGAKQSGQTPVVLPLAPGQYRLVLRLEGYGPYAGNVQVKDNIQTQLGVTLNERSSVHVAWAEVKTSPRGAEIVIDGASTGQFSPARVQVTAGTHAVVLKLDGYQQVRRVVQASEGGTVNVRESLKPK